MPKRAGSGGKVKDCSLSELQRELRRREGIARRVLRRRSALAKRLEALDAKLAAMGFAGGSPARRARNDMSLVEALARLLAGKQMGIPALLAALPTVGYRSESPNLRTMVNVALLKKSHFKRVGRGVYTAKATPNTAASPQTPKGAG